VRSLSPAARVGVLVLLTLAAIAIHETGHFLVYRFAGYPVRITLQSVRPTGPVNPTLDAWAKLAGPALSWTVAALCLVGAARRPGFVPAAAAFTNATLRLFPCSMDVVRALRGAPAFSDEGEIALALTNTQSGRAGVVVVALVLSLTLTVLAARQFGFKGRAAAKSVALYGVSLAVGILVVIADELVNG
jgi:hypothetical protein